MHYKMRRNAELLVNLFLLLFFENNELFSYNIGSEAMEQIAQRCSGNPIPRDIQGQTGWVSEQPDLAVGNPVC